MEIFACGMNEYIYMVLNKHQAEWYQMQSNLSAL